jgi:predicted ATPase
MIHRFRVQNYKALRDVSLELTPLHVLIGPNDSGKTSILEAIEALCRSVDHPLHEAFVGRWQGRELVWRHEAKSFISFNASIAKTTNGNESPSDTLYQLTVEFRESGRKAAVVNESVDGVSMARTTGRTSVCDRNASSAGRNVEGGKRIRRMLSGVHSYRWIPQFLALPVAPDSERRYRMESSGFGLALCLDDILGFDRDLFAKLETRFQAVFPDVESIKLIAESAYRAPPDDPKRTPKFQESPGKGIHFKFRNSDAIIPASQVSDGMLLILAYLTVMHLPEPPRVLLIEEPENGIHPKRIQEVLTILRELVESQSHTQVVMTTHSPYVVDQFDPAEVTLCTRQEDGSVSARRLSESDTVQRQIDIFTLGEVWTGEGDQAIADDFAPTKEPKQ